MLNGKIFTDKPIGRTRASIKVQCSASDQVNNATPSRAGQYESTHRMKHNQAMNEYEIYIRTSSMINVRCASVNQARAVVHELDTEARAQARTLRNAWIICT